MHYVYILQSINQPEKFYTGRTDNLKRRLGEHNSERNKGHTKKYAPWGIHSYFAFRDTETAIKFEAYLKTQAGRRFMKLRLGSE